MVTDAPGGSRRAGIVGRRLSGPSGRVGLLTGQRAGRRRPVGPRSRGRGAGDRSGAAAGSSAVPERAPGPGGARGAGRRLIAHRGGRKSVVWGRRVGLEKDGGRGASRRTATTMRGTR